MINYYKKLNNIVDESLNKDFHIINLFMLKGLISMFNKIKNELVLFLKILDKIKLMIK